MNPRLTQSERRLLNETQRGFPLEPRPFARLGETYGLDETAVLESIGRRRVRGVVVALNTLGASTLAAMTVPAALERGAA